MTDPETVWPDVPNRPDLPAFEAEVLSRWREHDVFHRSVALRAEGPVWTFYEGPPTANGRPGTHHVESRTFKDVFPRYRTMKGHLVLRKGGWDCHGLPVELEVERALGLNSKSDIERFGIEEFNRRCRDSVTQYVDVWADLTERIGFWVDLDDAYWTMDASYVDSLWWALAELWDRDLIHEDHRVTPYCARCGTALSDAEVAQGYATASDPSVYVRFPLLDGPLADEGASLLVWTTTPWTLHANNAVVVGVDIAYQLVRHEGRLLVIAADLRAPVLGDETEVVRDVTADELVGLHYQAPFEFVDVDTDYRYVVTGDFVTTTDGTGLVHSASAFGADDMAIGRAHDLPVVSAVDLEGRFTRGSQEGRFVKDADDAITQELDALGVLVKSGRYEHTYPFCWRCGTPLLYYAKPSWYIRTTAQRDRLLANNAGISWHPEHIREGRFGNWLENNVDWALSRDRYWGTPLPFWRCDSCEHVTVASSRAHLGELVGRDLSQLDPHRPYVDEIELTCPECGGAQRRVPEVADAWFDSGGMPFAQWGYPHQGHEEFERHFPADFIAEAIDQTRGWFYTLLAESTLLFDTSSFRTVLCLGHIVDEDGKKMSKSLGNVIDPFELIEAHGADALRWLMLAEGNPWVNRRVGHHTVEDVVRRFLLTLWNTHYFFMTYARLDGFDPRNSAPVVGDRPLLDRWILAELADLADTVDAAMDRYDVTTACRRIESFVDDLSNWYVRRSRRRFWRAIDDDPADKSAAYHTLWTSLRTLAGLLAPFTPFIADRLWYDLVASWDADAAVSVHLTDFPAAEAAWRDDELRAAMSTARRVVELGRQARNSSGVKVRQPLRRALVTVPEQERKGLATLVDEIADELNVKTIELATGSDELVDRTLKPNFRGLGPVFGKDAPRVAEAISGADPADVARVVETLRTAGTAELSVGGVSWSLTPEMVEVVETPRTGWELAAEASTSIALDLDLDDTLLAEGAARELVRALNDRRKALDLALNDRIEVIVEVSSPDLDRLLAEGGWYDVVAAEVLADEVRREAVTGGVAVDLGELGHATVDVRA
ncbi:MAG: isoleucine--tRNA ligase [Actinobacteria bacterium]|nr:isoleucine--tRNA ligase [Actinomycetota bacterium]